MKDSIFDLGESFRISPDSESGQAFLICEFFTFDHAPTLQLGKSSSVPFSALNNQTHLDQFRLAGPLSKKYQKQLILATRECSLGRLLLVRLFYLNGSCGFLLVAFREPDL